jgi:streptogramin lyase
MSIRVCSGLKSFVVCVAMALVAGCGGGGGGEPAAPDPGLPLMVDGFGRQVPEADFGRGDPFAAGAEGIAYDAGPIANAPVTLADNGGSTRTATTDATGYYRIDIKDLRLPFLVKVRRADGSEWYSAGASSAVTRGFVPININGLTDKVIGYVADAQSLGAGAASSVTPASLSPPQAMLDPVKARVRAALAVPLANAGLDAAGYDPMTVPVQSASSDRHASFLRRLEIHRNSQGRTVVIGTLAGTVSTLNAPSGVAVDGNGRVYLGDVEEHTIRVIGPDGVLAPFAGSGVPGYVDATGAAAAFNAPGALAVGAGGNVYVADQRNHAIRKITPAGMVSTLAGGGGPGLADGVGVAARFDGPSALAIDASGNVYVADGRGAVRKITPAGVVTTLARFSAQLPCCVGAVSDAVLGGITVDRSGNVYVGNLSDRTILKFTPAGVTSTWYSAPGTLFSPTMLVVDAQGTMYVTDYLANVVRKISPDGTATVLAGGTPGSRDGIGTSARFLVPSAIAIDAAGNLLVVDSYDGSIRKITPAGAVSTIAGKMGAGFSDGPAAVATFSGEWINLSSHNQEFVGLSGAAVDPSGNVFLADTGNHAIRKISPAGVVTTLAGNGSPGFANGSGRSASFSKPTAVTTDGSGNVYVADSDNNAIRRISPAGEVTTLAGNGQAGMADGSGGAARFRSPRFIAAGPDGSVYVADTGNVAIRRISPGGIVSTLAGVGPVSGVETATGQAMTSVGAIAVDSHGIVYFKATVNGLNNVFADIFTVTPQGAITRLTTVEYPWTNFVAAGLSVDADGNVYYPLWSSVDGATRLIRRTSAGVESELVTSRGSWALDASSSFANADGGYFFAVDAGDSAVRVVLP